MIPPGFVSRQSSFMSCASRPTGAKRKWGGVGVRLENFHVGKLVVGDEGARAAELHRVDVHSYDLSRWLDAPSTRPEDTHCPTTQIEASPARHEAELIEPRLGFWLPDARLET